MALRYSISSLTLIPEKSAGLGFRGSDGYVFAVEVVAAAAADVACCTGMSIGLDVAIGVVAAGIGALVDGCGVCAAASFTWMLPGPWETLLTRETAVCGASGIESRLELAAATLIELVIGV